MKIPFVKNNEYGQRWSFLDVFNIPDPTGRLVYLKRLRVVQTPLFGLYVHWINLPDDDRDPHDHPWNFLSAVLRGGYTEVVYKYDEHSDGPTLVAETTHGRWSAHRMPTDRAHRITHLQPQTVTLILTGRRSRDWGFWTEAGWVPWRQYDRTGHGPDPFMGEIGKEIS